MRVAVLILVDISAATCSQWSHAEYGDEEKAMYYLLHVYEVSSD
jgi:hypothetical protein